MKEINPFEKDKVEINNQSEKKFQENYLGSFKNLHKSHTLFEFNKNTFEIKPAIFSQQTIDFESAKNNLGLKRKKLIVKPDCIYVSALNIKNAIKKLNK